MKEKTCGICAICVPLAVGKNPCFDVANGVHNPIIGIHDVINGISDVDFDVYHRGR